MIRSSERTARPFLTVEPLEDRSVPAAGLAALGGEVRTMLTAFDSTALNAAVVTNGAYDGVATLTVTTAAGQRYRGSGSLLAEDNPTTPEVEDDYDPTYDYVLTAAHMVVDDYGNKMTSVTVNWPGLATATAGPSNIFVPKDSNGNLLWDGNPLNGNDIAVVRIAQLATTAPDRYQMFRDKASVDDPNGGSRTAQPEIQAGVFTRAGYGLPGTGKTGYTNNSSLFGTLRAGQNRYDDTYTPTTSQDWRTHTVLAYDFDSGQRKNDTIGRYFGIPDLGLGGVGPNDPLFESCAAPGDSGGPSFLNGKIAGITSAIQSFFFTDAKFGANSSFGDVGYDTRVALFADWVDRVIAGEESSDYGGTSGGGGGGLKVGLPDAAGDALAGVMPEQAAPAAFEARAEHAPAPVATPQAPKAPAEPPARGYFMTPKLGDGGPAWVAEELPGPPEAAAEVRNEHMPEQAAARDVRADWAERVPEAAQARAHWGGPAAWVAPEQARDPELEFLGGVPVK